MDSVTHTIIGATVSYALFGGKLGRKAAAVGALAGVLPDIDGLISSKADPLLYVEFHRYFTHSLLFALVGAFVATLPWVLRSRYRACWHLFWLCALPAYVSHCLLDACTTYGTQIYWPFSRERVGWDFISIIDPLFTITALVLLTCGLIKQRRSFATGAAFFALLYLSAGAQQRSRAAEVQRLLAQERGHLIERSEIMPTLGNNLVWRSLYLAGGRIYSDRIRVGWFSSPTIRQGTSLPVETPGDLTPTERSANEQTNAFARFAWFSDGWLSRSPGDPSVLGDMRYSISTRAFDPVWGIRLSMDEGEQGRVEWVNRSRERKPQTKELWSEIRGSHIEYRSLHRALRSPQFGDQAGQPPSRKRRQVTTSASFACVYIESPFGNLLAARKQRTL